MKRYIAVIILLVAAFTAMAIFAEPKQPDIQLVISCSDACPLEELSMVSHDKLFDELDLTKTTTAPKNSDNEFIFMIEREDKEKHYTVIIAEGTEEESTYTFNVPADESCKQIQGKLVMQSDGYTIKEFLVLY